MSSLTNATLGDAIGVSPDLIADLLAISEPAPKWPTSVPWPYHGALVDLTTDELKGIVAYLRHQLDAQQQRQRTKDLQALDAFLRDTAEECTRWRGKLAVLLPGDETSTFKPPSPPRRHG